MDMIDRSKEMLKLPTEEERVKYLHDLVKDEIIGTATFAFLLDTLGNYRLEKEKKNSIEIPEKLKWDIMYALRIAKEKCDAEDSIKVTKAAEDCEELFCEWKPADSFTVGDEVYMIAKTSKRYGAMRMSDGYFIEDTTKKYVNVDHFMATHWSGAKKLSK